MVHVCIVYAMVSTDIINRNVHVIYCIGLLYIQVSTTSLPAKKKNTRPVVSTEHLAVSPHLTSPLCAYISNGLHTIVCMYTVSASTAFGAHVVTVCIVQRVRCVPYCVRNGLDWDWTGSEDRTDMVRACGM